MVYNISILLLGNFVQYIMKALHEYCENGMKDSSLDDNKSVVASFCEDDMNGKEKEIGELPSITGEQPPESQNKIIGIKMTNRKEIANETVHVENSRHCKTPDKKVEKRQTSDNIFTYFTEEQLSSLFVKNKNGERTAFCDLGKLSLIILYMYMCYVFGVTLLIIATNHAHRLVLATSYSWLYD